MPVESHKLRFNLDKPSDREAWDTLQAIPAGQRNQFILQAIHAYAVEPVERERLAQRIAELVVDMLPGVSAAPSAEPAPERDVDTQARSLEIAEEFLDAWM